MQKYRVLNLSDVLKKSDETVVVNILEKFSCPQNSDVEDFLRNKAIIFSRQGLAGVWLVFAPFSVGYVLAGYFALANKYFQIDFKVLSKTLQKKLKKFATPDEELGKYVIVAPLIGQLGKNYHNGYDKLITGDELLQIACDTVREAQRILGGKLVYLECEDKQALREFYERNNFSNFGQRDLDSDEKETLDGNYLLQFFKYFND